AAASVIISGSTTAVATIILPMRPHRRDAARTSPALPSPLAWRSPTILGSRGVSLLRASWEHLGTGCPLRTGAATRPAGSGMASGGSTVDVFNELAYTEAALGADPDAADFM